MTGEEHFHSSQKSQNGGLVVRIHNAENLIYTTSREHADDICDFIASNYGVLGKIFIEHIISHIDSLQQKYETARDMHQFTPLEYKDFSPLIDEFKGLKRNTEEFRTFVQRYVIKITAFSEHLEIELNTGLGMAVEMNEVVSISRENLYEMYGSRVRKPKEE